MPATIKKQDQPAQAFYAALMGAKSRRRRHTKRKARVHKKRHSTRTPASIAGILSRLGNFSSVKGRRKTKRHVVKRKRHTRR